MGEHRCKAPKVTYGINCKYLNRVDGMGTKQRVGHSWQRLIALLAVVVLAFGTFSCAKPTAPKALMSEPAVDPNPLAGRLNEVSPPEPLQLLKQVIDAYTPQVRILSPRPGEILEDTSVTVRFQVRGLPIFKNETWQLGPHLHVFLDGEPYQAVYDLSEPLVFKDLSPGTHTLRVFASRPWHESFKNQGAFDQRTFHIFAQTPQDELDADQPLLTYSRPQGSYGAEPIMLDFYLTNTPLHMVAQEDPNDDIPDWRIRCTVNGESFVFDQWQPIYLKGFKPGKNWVQLELMDEAGHPIENRFNNTVRVIDYEPGGDDTLSKLVRGELDVREIAGIIDPTYEPPAKPEPETTTEEPTPPVLTEPKATQAPPEELPETQEPETVQEPETAQEPETTQEPATSEPSEVSEPSNLAPASPMEPEPKAELELPSTLDEEMPAQSEEDQELQPTQPKTPEVELPDQSQKAEKEESPLSGDAIPSESTGRDEDTLPSEKVETSEQNSAFSSDLKKLESGPSDTESNPPELDQQPATDFNGSSSGTLPPKEDETSPQVPSVLPAGPETTIDQEARDEAVEQPSENSLSDRYQRWRRQLGNQMQKKFSKSAPEQAPDVFLAPSPETASDPEEPSRSSENSAKFPEDNEPREMPDLIEPYLTEPYLTEPRLDIDPFDDKKAPETPERSPKAPGETPTPSIEQPFI
jgi:hypothetical protein